MHTLVLLTSSMFLLAPATAAMQAQTAQLAGAGIDPALLAMAKGGDAASQLALADCYEDGKCAPLDADEALVWYRKAAEGGNATAQFIIAWEYYDGSDIDLAPKNHLPKDPIQSAAWFRRVAEHADQIDFGLLEDAPPSAKSYGTLPRAMGGQAGGYFFLGSLFEEGKDLPQDYSQAAFWYRMGAEEVMLMLSLRSARCMSMEKGCHRIIARRWCGCERPQNWVIRMPR